MFRYELQGETNQAIELYTQANVCWELEIFFIHFTFYQNLVPSDPAILLKLANLYDVEGDKSQAFQCHYDVNHLIIKFENGC